MTITVSPSKGSTHAKCVDGKYSTSTVSGTCSGHGGVDCESSWSYGHVKCHGTAPSPAATVTASPTGTNVPTSTVTSTASPTALPVTGAGGTGAFVAGGGGLLALGVAAVYLTRKRKKGVHA